ncbi:MAG: ATP-dependent dethiobiotin synthetase BioD, partial [Actinomycetota bacterium]
EVGKTWVGARLLESLRAQGRSVAAWKAAQAWDPDERAAGAPTDAELLAAATGQVPDEVCPPHRSYPVALAPPMAADRLDLPTISLADLLAEVAWSSGTEVGLVEGAGGSRSPVAHDADGADLARALEPDLVVVVADAGLGTIHAVRSARDGLDGLPVVAYLNRFDEDDPLHAGNRTWLRERAGLTVLTDIPALAAATAG